MENRAVEKAAGAIADTYRLAILVELSCKKRLSPIDIQQLTGLSQPAVSHHVKRLIESELIISKKEGRNIFLMLNTESLKQLAAFFKQLITIAN